MSRQSSTTLYCFSPPVMLATLVTETILAIYTVWRYKMTVVTRLITAMFICLATFQLAEYFVCTGYGLRAEQWSRVGFVMITILPPLGLHLAHVLAQKPKRRLVAISYATMVAYIGIFMFYHAAFNGHQCTGNYVIFQIGARLGGLYSIYYFGWLAVGIGLSVVWANQLMKKGQAFKKYLESVRGLIVGYLVFLIPVALANTIKPQTRRGIPSIMCGFAILLALILATYVLPRIGQRRHPATRNSNENHSHPL
jgi:hypothetical protein